jgi:serine/threonine-protein kinase
MPSPNRESHALETPSRLGRYELLVPLVRGGMGEVWLGRALGPSGFERLFAIKTIRTDKAEDGDFRAMFLDEARIAARIQSEYAVPVFDLGEEGGVLYMVMEWVHGDPVSRITRIAAERNAPMPLHVALSIVCDACRGLHVAHQQTDAQGASLDVVHRDVSPHNLLVTENGVTKVIDFGIAKARDRWARKSSAGKTKGKLRYMAPEQVTGGEIDRRADVWSLGVVLYELCCGRPPYDGESDAAVLGRLLSQEAPELPESVPQEIRAVVRQALARNADARFASCEQLRRALDAAAGAIGMVYGHEEVAAYLHAHMSDLGNHRRDLLARTLGGGKSSEAQSPWTNVRKNDAFDSTQIAAATPAESAEPRAPDVQRRAAGPADATMPATLVSLGTHGAPHEPSAAGRAPRRVSWTSALGLVAIGATIAGAATVAVQGLRAPRERGAAVHATPREEARRSALPPQPARSTTPTPSAAPAPTSEPASD